MNSDTSGNFVFFGGLMLLGVLVCGATVAQAIPGLIAVYFMLVATNAIARGENRARKKNSQQQQKLRKK